MGYTYAWAKYCKKVTARYATSCRELHDKHSKSLTING